MIVLGLTGSIGMGKSAAAALLRRLGVPVHDADASVHRLLGRDGAAVQRVAAAFPGTGGANGIDRTELGRRLTLRRLAEIVRVAAGPNQGLAGRRGRWHAGIRARH